MSTFLTSRAFLQNLVPRFPMFFGLCPKLNLTPCLMYQAYMEFPFYMNIYFYLTLSKGVGNFAELKIQWQKNYVILEHNRSICSSDKIGRVRRALGVKSEHYSD